MSSDYQAIRRDNERRYGTDIGRIGPMLLADRYDDRTHFIFELLQNAEDALARRGQWQGARSVSFQLTPAQLRVSHFGQPFNEADVRGICGIAESTKTLTAIGRFGIGFKSVYAITDRPEVHSGREAFAIESFVLPVGVQGASRHPDETLFVLPFKPDDAHVFDDVSRGLQSLGATVLLFLRQIEEVRWSIEGGHSGTYLRDSKDVASWVRRVTVIGQQEGAGEVDDEWLVFSRAVTAHDGGHAGYVEIAFSLSHELAPDERIQRIERSPLVVFFPTVVETHLGFLLQGPYRTTPSRDNVPRSDPWNQHLVQETGLLLVDALRWLRDNELLDTAALRCLPIDPSKFGEPTMFAPLFQVTKEALSSQDLLPRFRGGYVPATGARLGRTQEIRELLSASQLAALLGERGQLCWLSGDISQDRAPDLRRYLMQELGVTEVTPEAIIPKLNKPFLEAQSDAWIIRLYEFLKGQPALRRRLDELPLIRLEDGTHVLPQRDGQPQAFLPGAITTGFPTVRASVCTDDTAREFLRSLGLTEPDPVDDVVRNVLPKYQDKVAVSGPEYEADVRRILTAFGTDSKAQREKLIAALRDSAFVMAIDAGDSSKRPSKPGEVYLATERLKELFAGVKGVLVIDDAYACLRGEDVRELLEACGATRYLQPVPTEGRLSWEKRSEIRRNAGLERATWERPVADVTLRGLDKLLQLLPQLEPEARRYKAALLWDALADVESRRGSRVFVGEYTWGYSHETKTATFDAAFVRQLNETAWIPDGDGDLQRPEFVLFDSLGWKENPFLLSKIRFKPPIIEALAREAGIEPGVLDLLKKHGVTSVAELVARLGLSDESKPNDGGSVPETEDNAAEPKDDVPLTDSNARATDDSKADGSRGRGNEATTATGAAGSVADGRRESDGTAKPSQHTEREAEPGRKEAKRTSEGKPATFISYVGAHPDDEEPDPEGLDQEARMALEAKAIEFILSREPTWRRTSTHNPGYDLYLADEGDNATQWCEVKAMTGSLDDHPVGLSRTQFDFAREHGEAYWLYVVEHVGTDKARIVRIQDPAGKARTFTFDRGWISVARLDGVPEGET